MTVAMGFHQSGLANAFWFRWSIHSLVETPSRPATKAKINMAPANTTIGNTNPTAVSVRATAVRSRSGSIDVRRKRRLDRGQWARDSILELGELDPGEFDAGRAGIQA